MTVIEVPRSFLDEIRSDEWHPLTEGNPMWSSAEDAVIARYVEERGARSHRAPGVGARRLRRRDQRGYVEGEDPAATILDAAERLSADVIVVSATKPLFDESQWESVSARVIREARRPVLVVPTRGNPESDDQ